MPSKTVFAIAMTDGARAEHVGRQVATRLGYRYVNNEIIDRAAQQAGVDSETGAAVEHSEPMVARIMHPLTHLQADEFGAYSAAALDPTSAYRSLRR